jgi:hypothetical protein
MIDGLFTSRISTFWLFFGCCCSDTYTLGAALTPERCKGTMYEHFVVVGVSNAEVAADETKILKPEILYAYPEDSFKKVDSSVKDFAFPTGVEVRGFSSKVSSTDLLSIRFSTAASLENPASSFVFVMTTQNLLYGVCVYTEEIMSDRGVIIPPKYVNPNGVTVGSLSSSTGSAGDPTTSPSPVDSPASSSSSIAPPSGTNASPSSAKIQRLRDNFKARKDAVMVSTKRCYLFISRFPFFQLHFDILYSLIARDRLYRQSRLEEVKERGENKTSVASGLIRQTLDAYYNQKIAEMGTTLSFSIPGEIRTIQFVCPPSDDVSSLADWCVACLLRVLSFENIIKFFNAIVMEHRIVLICSNLGVLSAVALSLIPLLRPLIWQGAFIPILPNTMLDILDAPFPLTVGLPKYPELRSLVDFVVVDLDQNTVTPPMKAQRGIRGTFSSSSLIPLPDVAKLEEKLKPFTDKLYLGDPVPGQKRFRENPLKTTTAQLAMVKNVSKLFTNYIETVLGMIRDSIIQSSFELNEENFDEQSEKVPALLPRTYRKFVTHLFQTQIFNFYSHSFLYHLANRQLEDELLYSKLQGLLEMEREERAAIEAKLRKLPPKGSERDRYEKDLKGCIARITDLEKSEKDLTKKDPNLVSPKRPSTLRGIKSGADMDLTTSSSSSSSTSSIMASLRKQPASSSTLRQ